MEGPSDSVSEQKVKLKLTAPTPELGKLGKESLFSWTIWTILDGLGLIIVLVVQGSILNYYIVKYNDRGAGWYFLFFVDFVVLLTFMFSITFAWRFYQRQRRERASLRSAFKTGDIEGSRKVGKGIFAWTFPKEMGMLPPIYLCWIAYSLILTMKIYMIIIMEIPEKMVADNESDIHRGGEILALTLAGAVFVFILWTEAHKNLEDDEQRQLSKACFDDLTSHTLFEIFDSVIFLNLILPATSYEVERDKLKVPYSMKMFILVIASLNFLIPSLGLYRLSRIDFGAKLGKLKITNESTAYPSTRGLNISIVYHTLRLLAINVPYLIVRVHLSASVGKDLSIFILKNILGIWIALRSLVPEIKEWIYVHRMRTELIRQVAMGTTQPAIRVDTFGQMHGGWETDLFDGSKSTKSGSHTQGSITQETSLDEVTTPSSSTCQQRSYDEQTINRTVESVNSDAIEVHIQNELNKRF